MKLMGPVWRRILVPLAVTGLVIAGLSPTGAPHAPFSVAHADELSAPSTSLQESFAAAAPEFGVPEEILLAVSYNVSRWEHHNGEPSVSAGFGLMHLTDLAYVDNHDKGDEEEIERYPDEENPTFHTLDTAAGLIGTDKEAVRENPAENIRGAAALLAQYARETAGHVPPGLADWYGAVAKYSGSDEASVALDFADQVYATIKSGAERVTSDGQVVKLKPTQVEPNKATADPLNLRNTKWTGADCPNGTPCRMIPARYALNNAATGDYGNYDTADRPNFGPKIDYIIIHDTEGAYQSAINWFRNRWAYVAAHYVLRSVDGEVTQMMDNKDVGWHAGNWYFNMHSVGIEHEGYALQGAAWYNEQLYRSSARLVRHLAEKYGVPLDRAHIIGHDEIPGLTTARQRAMHWDPGPYWDWEHFMELVGAPITPAGGSKQIVTIKPHFETNLQAVNTQPVQPANFVYLHQAPSATAPLADDPHLTGPGTRNGSDWGSKARTGQSFAVAGQEGDWTAIWNGGQKVWFYNPPNQNAVPGTGVLVTPKAGKSSIPVYGAAWPEASAYPAGVPVRALSTLYNMPAGQVYVAVDKVKGDNYHAVIYSLDPNVHTHVQGQEEFYRIQYNHRFGFVKASDVDVVPAK